MLHAVIGTGIFGHIVKLYKPNETNYLFDGASLMLYMVAVVVYGTSILHGILLDRGTKEGLQSIQTGDFDEGLTKADTLRVIAASHVILAVVLIGSFGENNLT
jgi:hypothetical protein